MTIIIIIVTVIISVLANYNEQLFSKLQLNPYLVVHRKQYYRLLTHAFVHGGWWHLFVNMFVLYFFGTVAEKYIFSMHLQGILKYPILVFILFYFTSIIFASSTSVIKHKDNHWYNSVGASGAVAAILFFAVFFDPWMRLELYMIIPIPGIIFAVLYVAYSHIMGKKGGDNINHDAHLLGSIYGFIFPLFIDLQLIGVFINNLLGK